MHTVGIVAEYNPFHTGHEYHIKKSKEESGADYAVVVMSPDFVQRGEPAVFDKYTRTKLALLGGADLVLELPICYATGSAEYFAEGAIALLDALGIVDVLCFGGESDDITLFQNTAEVLLAEPLEYRQMLQMLLKEGKSYPLARSEALAAYLNMENAEELNLRESYEVFLRTPNNILGIEYCKALRRRNSSIVPLPILRQGSGYSSKSLNSSFCSATALRCALSETRDLKTADRILSYIPQDCRDLFCAASRQTLSSQDFLPYMEQKLLASENYTSVLDISADLSDRMKKMRFKCIGASYESIVSGLKTRQITESRIRRSLLHLMLDISAESVEDFRLRGTVFYSRVLGFRKTAAPLLHEIKQRTEIPFIVKNASGEKILSDPGAKMWKQDLYASHLYRSVLASRYQVPFRTEYECSPIVL